METHEKGAERTALQAMREKIRKAEKHEILLQIKSFMRYLFRWTFAFFKARLTDMVAIER